MKVVDMKIRTSVRLEKEIHEAIAKIAAEETRSMNNVIILLLKRGLERMAKK